jgi:hypothetical protein
MGTGFDDLHRKLIIILNVNMNLHSPFDGSVVFFNLFAFIVKETTSSFFTVLYADALYYFSNAYMK